jgi:hypothetical protein
MNILATLTQWAGPVTTLGAGIAFLYLPFQMHSELQVVKASNADMNAHTSELRADMKANNAAVNDVKASNIELKAAMLAGFAELKADKRRWF